MGDVAQILKDTKIDGEEKSSMSPSKAMAMSGLPKDVMKLLGGKQDPKSAALPPIVPTTTSSRDIKVKVGNKTISSSKPARQWTWAPFCSSGRTDGAIFSHWVRANVEYTDYPYAKFDIHLDPVAYNDEDYEALLKNDGWTKGETDKLMEFCRIYELRWPVIHDRWLGYFDSTQANITPGRKIEDLQERYYGVAATLAQAKIRQEAAKEVEVLTSVNHDPAAPNTSEKVDQTLLETAAARALATAAPKAQPLMTNLGTGSTNKTFDIASERERRAQLDRMWRRTKEEEQEEMELRKELREIDAHLRKLKKSGGHVLAAAGNRVSANAANSRNVSRSVTPVPGSAIVDNPELLDRSFASTAPQPMPQNPYLQSGRLVSPAAGGSTGVNKTMLTRMQQVLAELNVSARPLPTKRVCDLYDTVRKDILALITLQKMVLQKEGTLHTKRLKLSKLDGGDDKVLDEEELLGIAPPPPPPGPAPTATKKGSKSSASGGKAKSASGSKSKASGKSKTGGEMVKDGEKKKTAKRKRKVDGKESSSTKKGGSSTASSSAKTPSKTVSATSNTKATPTATTPAATSSKTPATASKDTKAASTSPTPEPSSTSPKKRARKS